MKHRIYLLFTFCLLFQVFSSAQQNRFLYIQTENRQPFYVNLNNNILSSSASGYLIIPKLQEGSYQLTIGFPKNEWPRQVITYNVGKKDQGVLLKNFGEQGWGFYNLQSTETIMAAGNKPKAEAMGEEDNDSFTQVLSEVVNTPDLKIKTKVEAPVPVVVPDAKPAEPSFVEATPGIKRISENLNEQGRELVYVDAGDTISIFIPATVKAEQPVSKTPDTIQPEIKMVDANAIVSGQKTGEDKPAVIETKTEMDNKVVVPVSEPAVPTRTKAISMINSDCKGNANDDDFMKLRKKMAAEDNEVKMVVVAKKAFKSKCYSTSQLKNLSVLFLNDSGRFQFFESAYPFVSDSNNFIGLQTQLTDPYYITRFESLIRR